MNNLKLLTVSFAIAVIFAASAIAQTTGTSPVPSKIGWIDTGSFADEKNGVTRFLNGLKAIDAEFKPKVAELERIKVKLTVISDALRNPNTAVPESLQTKRDEGERLQREAEFKKKEYEALYTKRRNEVIGPISADIIKAMQDFARQKGYAVILDIGSLAQTNSILILEPSADTTKEFVAFYNARPAVSAVLK
ncbi:MAG: OmpH family outer membrane protein [Pyrinomonadaceae bacterium]